MLLGRLGVRGQVVGYAERGAGGGEDAGPDWSVRDRGAVEGGGGVSSCGEAGEVEGRCWEVLDGGGGARW